jgi:hypothetical protein
MLQALWHGKGGLGLHAELAHGLAVALEVDVGAVGDGEAAILSGDLQPVLAPGASPVEVTKVAVVPLSYIMTAVTSSSTSI